MNNLKRKIILLFSILLVFNINAQDNIPSIDLKTLDGKTLNIQAVTDKDNVVIISLWATWCVPCIKELDAISDVYDEWQEETGVELIAISVDDSRTVNRVKALINGKGWDYQVLLDTNNDLKRALGASTVPLTIVIKDNKIVLYHMRNNLHKTRIIDKDFKSKPFGFTIPQE